MSEKVLNIKLSFPISALIATVERSPGIHFIHVDHAGTSKTEENLIQLSRRNPDAKLLLVALANLGFLPYVLRDGVTSLVHFDRVGTLWAKVRDGSFHIDENGLVYSLTAPRLDVQQKKLLVVFSSMAAKIYTASLMRHFEQNFASIQKFIPGDVSILRIADLGGVVGAYYMNTHARPNNEEHVRGLIERIAKKNCVEHNNIVLYGVSKGGTAALYHGLHGGYKLVAVDPIVADAHYIEVHRDSHFTVGIFPQDKKDKFAKLADGLDARHIRNVSIICSERSPQFPYITSAFGSGLKEKVAFFNSLNPAIKTHPDVGPSTVNLAVTLINAMFYDLPVPPGIKAII